MSGDLVPMFSNSRPSVSGGRQVGFRQGSIVTWNRLTAENTVLVGEELFTNLPILNTSEAAILAEGDVVGLLTMGPTWGILGRFTIPGTPEAVSSLSSLRTQSAEVLTSETTSSGSFVDLATVGPAVTIDVGPSGRVLVTVGAEVAATAVKGSVLNTAGAGMSYAISGASTAVAVDRYAAIAEIAYDSTPTFTSDLKIRTGASRTMLREGLAPGATTFTAKYRRYTSGTATFINRNITVIAI